VRPIARWRERTVIRSWELQKNTSDMDGFLSCAGPTSVADAGMLPVATNPRSAAATNDGLPLMAVGHARPASSPVPLPVAVPAGATAPMSMLAVGSRAAQPATLVDTSTPAAGDTTVDSTTQDVPAPAPAPAAVQDPLATTKLTMPQVRTDVKGPVALSQAAWDAIARLRLQLATASAVSAAAPNNAVAASNVRVLQSEIAAVLSGYIDPSQVSGGGGNPTAAPVCASAGAQCGGLQPGSNTDVWRGPSECCGNGTMTCVQTDPSFAQCVPVAESRARGCSALYARCGGDFWEGPFCCATNQGCIYESNAMSRCAQCNNMYAQCGGLENGKPWTKPSCCASGGTCKQINQYYYQCAKQ